MSEDFLSQDEIDALLGDSYPPIEDDPSFEEADAYTLAEAIRVCVANAFQEASTLLTQPAEIEFLGVDLKGLQPLEGDQTEWVSVELDLSGDLQGIFVFLFHPSWVRTVAEMGKENQGDLIAGTELARFEEFLYPFASTVEEQLSTLLGLDLRAHPNSPRGVDLSQSVAALPFGQNERVITFELLTQAGDDSSFPGRLLIPNEVAEILMDRLTAMNGSDAPEQDSGFVADQPGSPIEPAPAANGHQAHEAAPAAAASASPQPRGEVRKAEFASLGGASVKPGTENIDLLLDVPLNITVELGRAEMEIREILALSKGQVIELDKLAGEPVDVFVNGKLVAKGEVVVMDENFGVKISTIVSRQERMQNLQ